jgi:multidrug efflux pump subunit AcrA (membrane-fusion protein)
VESIMQSGVKYLVPGLFLVPLLVLAGCSQEPPVAEPPAPPKVSQQANHQGKRDRHRGIQRLAGGQGPGRSPVARSRLREGHSLQGPASGKARRGELVKKGDPLFDLDPDEFQDQIVQAEQKVNVFKAQKVAAEK